MANVELVATSTGKRRFSAVAAALALLLGVGHAAADSLPATPPDAPPAASAKAAGPAGEKTAIADRDAVREGEKRLRGMYARVVGIQRARELAASRKDSFQVSCVQHQEAKAKVTMQLAQEAHQALAKAAAEGSDEESTYQAARLKMLDEILQTARKDAQLCVHDEVSSIQTQQVEVHADPGRGGPDPTAPSTPRATSR